METSKYVRKPLYIDAVQVTAENIEEVAKWSGGEVQTAKNPRTQELDKFIYINVPGAKHPRQTRAFIGDWILKFREHFKIYTKKAFPESFDPAPLPASDFEILRDALAYDDKCQILNKEDLAIADALI